jgi:hypothetical protein
MDREFGEGATIIAPIISKFFYGVSANVLQFSSISQHVVDFDSIDCTHDICVACFSFMPEELGSFFRKDGS